MIAFLINTILEALLVLGVAGAVGLVTMWITDHYFEMPLLKMMGWSFVTAFATFLIMLIIVG